MHKHTRLGITAEHTGTGMFVTTHVSAESPLSLATEKAAQLHALLSIAGDYAAVSTLGHQDGIQAPLFVLAVALANETLVLSELASSCGGETTDRVSSY